MSGALGKGKKDTKMRIRAFPVSNYLVLQFVFREIAMLNVCLQTVCFRAIGFWYSILYLHRDNTILKCLYNPDRNTP